MEKNTIKVTVNIEDCVPIEEVYYLKIAVPDRQGLNKSLDPQLSVQYETSLSSGVLSRIKNSLILRIYKTSEYNTDPNVALFMKFSPTSNNEVVLVKSNPTVQFTDASGAVLQNGFAMELFTPDDAEYTTTTSMGAEYLQYEYVSETHSAAWPEQECVLNFEIPVTFKKLPRFAEEPQVILKEELPRKLDTTPFFNSEVLSDVDVECGSTVYPAHQLVLAGKSPILQEMLTLQTKKSRKSQIIIKDADPQVFEALLRFIYTGEVDPVVLEERREDLYRAADRYDVKDLLLYCEAHLIENVKPVNALVMYDLAQCRPNSALAKKCSEIIARNRNKIAADVDSFKNFAIKYPDLIFEIFRK